MVRRLVGALISMAIVGGGCSAETAPCPEPVGVWVLRATETSGTCGDLNTETGPFLGRASSGTSFLGQAGACEGEWTATDSTMCVYRLSRTCPVGQSLTAEITYVGSDRTDRWSGTGQGIADGSGGFACVSTFEITASKE